MISRRQMLAMAGAAPVWSVLKSSAEAQGAPQTAQTPAAPKSYPRMGGTPTRLYAALAWPPEGAQHPLT